MLTHTEAVSLSLDEKAELLAFARKLAGEAGAVILPYFRQPLEVENKLADGRFDPVTQADRAGERVIRDGIAAQYPQHGILGEELGHKEGNGLTWVIDPIDGTRAFMTGMLHWGVLLALFDGRRPVLGVMHQPFTNEFFEGDGETAEYRRGKIVCPLKVRACDQLAEAVVATTSPVFFRMPEERAGFARLEAAAKLTRYGGDCYIYAMLAMGHVDIATDSSLNPYDIQAHIPIIEGAGGVVTCADGSDPSLGGFVVASCSRGLHEQALRVIAASP